MTATMTATGLSKRFEHASPSGAPVLDGAEISAASGCLTLIRGSAGSGRTTAARCLTGVYRPDAGEVTVRVGAHDAVDLTSADARTVAWLRAHHIASFDGPLAAAPTLNAQTAIMRAAGCSAARAVAGLDRLGAGGVAQRPLGRLRDAQRHTVALAAALLSGRTFLVLDGPDEYAAPATLASWLAELTAAGAAVVVTASDTHPLEPIATSVGDLRQGEISWHRR